MNADPDEIALIICTEIKADIDPRDAARAATEILRYLECIVSCPSCGRSVLAVSKSATGWIAPCGRRLMILSECGTTPQCRDAGQG